MSVLLAGDSHAVGLRSYLRAMLGSNFIDGNPVSGTKTTQWTSKIANLVSQYNPDVVVLCLGTNDEGGSTLAQVSNAAQQIVDACSNSYLLWCLPLIAGTDVPDHGVSNVISGIAPHVFDPNTLGLPIGYDSDGRRIHATPQGYQTWAAAIVNYLNGVQLGNGSNAIDAGQVNNPDNSTTDNTAVYELIGVYLLYQLLF